eukprot:tig00021339_g20390.t1
MGTSAQTGDAQRASTVTTVETVGATVRPAGVPGFHLPLLVQKDTESGKFFVHGRTEIAGTTKWTSDRLGDDEEAAQFDTLEEAMAHRLDLLMEMGFTHFRPMRPDQLQKCGL